MSPVISDLSARVFPETTRMSRTVAVTGALSQSGSRQFGAASLHGAFMPLQKTVPPERTSQNTDLHVQI